MDDRCRYCGQEPEIAEYGMCATCQAREEADAARLWPDVEAWMAEQDRAAREQGKQ